MSRAEPEGTAGDLAIVLHSHMPYVEGFGTYPFGEEWLFDAVARSYLPVLEVAEKLTMTITPVLADQLEAEGVGERMLEFLRRHRLGAAERDAAEADPELRPAAAADAEAYGRAILSLEALGGDALRAFQAANGRVELMASAATHAVLPKLATVAGRRLQIDAGLRSHTRRFGRPAGFWLPECAYAAGIEGTLAERGLDYTCLDLSSGEADGAALAPVRLDGGLTGFTIDWPAVELVWSGQGYPSDPAYLEYHRLSPNGMRLWSIGGQAYDPDAARARAGEQAREFLRAVRGRLAARAGGKARGLCVFAIDTELLGHWWAEGPSWLSAVLSSAEEEGVRLLTLSEALAEHEPESRPAFESSWGEGKSLETWDSPAVRDLAWASRRLELRMLDALADGLPPGSPGAERAARELLAVQSSDWAFMDHRGQAGDYPFRRATGHAEAMLEALEDPHGTAPRQRDLAPDLSLAPLLEP
jgi:1,4-alpha-glucan branching enzyme